jgi:ABC-2 type transport system ATP-binding protein
VASERPVPALSTIGLTKKYGRLVAINGLTLDVMRGEVFGFLGLNGAGKTTTIRVLLNLLHPTSGTAAVLGYDCVGQSIDARALIGYLPGEMELYHDLTGRELLEFLARLRPRRVDDAYRSELLERLQLPPADLRKKLREYSTGMKRKLGLVQAFQADPPLLILDEPTEGLDPLMQEAFYDLLASVRKRGRTVFMSSHVLSEVERVCDRIGLLRAGTLVLLSSVEHVRRMAPRRVRIIFAADVACLPPGLPDACEVVEVKAREWRLRTGGPIGKLLSYAARFPVADIEISEPRLEDVLIQYYREGDA